VYDSEKPTPNLYNQLLNEIQKGVQLKRTKCNDRSRPFLQGLSSKQIYKKNLEKHFLGLGEGLGVFRRQVTVEDPQEPTTPLMDPDEDYDDIDKVRDDLQSTKQLLEIEMKNRTKMNDENHKLQMEIRRLREELNRRPTVSAPAPAPYTLPPVTLNHVTKKSASKAAIRSRKADDSEEDSDEDFGELDAVEEEMNGLRGQLELARNSAAEYEHR
jgi:regulator of replication initiation timing